MVKSKTKKQEFATLSSLGSNERAKVIQALQACVGTGIDLYAQIKVAHWNMKGSHFLSLHPFMDTIATAISDYNDTLAERAIALGGRVDVTIRVAAKQSALSEYPAGVVECMAHAKNIIAALRSYEKVLHQASSVAKNVSDKDTEDMITLMTTELEKHGWFLLAFTS